MIIFTQSDIEKLLPMDDCVGLMAEAMRQTSQGRAVTPLRQFMAVPERPGKQGLMPGFISEPACFGVKVVSKFERAPDSPHGSHVGTVLLFDAEEGLLRAMFEGGSLTAIRTAAASAMATDTLARKDAHILTIMGCGEQARHHIAAMRTVRDLSEVRIWGRSLERAEAFVDELKNESVQSISAIASAEDAVKDAHIICTVTSAKEPILRGEWLPPGVHVNLVGSAVPHTSEADIECVKRCRYYVDYRPSAEAQAGELLNAIKAGTVTADHIVGEIGQVLLNEVPGRQSDGDITLYKSLGTSAQDLIAAHHIYTSGLEQEQGTRIDLMD